MNRSRIAAFGCAIALLAAMPLRAADATDAALQDVDRIFAEWRLDSHVPGLVYGIVKDGALLAVRGQGVQDVTGKHAVDADSLFRIASMSKAFTALAILKLRDEGRLSLDAAAETYVPEMRGWSYPTKDSRKIRVRDLLNHVAGFVTDDPWGDRHQPLGQTQFTQMLKAGVPFARAPGIAMEYSNFGYATLGRIIDNVAHERYQDYIRDTFLVPLGMTSTTYDIAKSPPTRRALGYRWQDDGWVREPDMADGAFGAMGGIETSAKDYARWVAFLLSAWPPRDEPDTGPVARATVREIVEGSNFPRGIARAPAAGGAPCRLARTYAMAWYVIDDCDLGRVLTHSGGYPGYGSNVLLLPDKGIGIFVLTNRTYSGPAPVNLKAMLALQVAQPMADRRLAVSARVQKGYEVARQVWASGSVADARSSLAMNFLLDRDEAHWARELARLRAEVGACNATEAVQAGSALQGRFVWTCERGRIEGSFLLAPTNEVTLQQLLLDVARP